MSKNYGDLFELIVKASVIDCRNKGVTDIDEIQKYTNEAFEEARVYELIKAREIDRAEFDEYIKGLIKKNMMLP